MCCRACHGYETCQSQQELREDCCPKCVYFADCMEKDVDAETNHRPPVPSRRPYRPKK
jgi:hypothetical protein